MARFEASGHVKAHEPRDRAFRAAALAKFVPTAKAGQPADKASNGNVWALPPLSARAFFKANSGLARPAAPQGPKGRPAAASPCPGDGGGNPSLLGSALSLLVAAVTVLVNCRATGDVGAARAVDALAGKAELEGRLLSISLAKDKDPNRVRARTPCEELDLTSKPSIISAQARSLPGSNFLADLPPK